MNIEKEQTMSNRETLAAADLIPGDVIVPEGDEVVGYPHRGAGGRTALPVLRGNVAITFHVDSEKQYTVIR